MLKKSTTIRAAVSDIPNYGGAEMISTMVTSGGANNRMGGPQVPLPRETWMVDAFCVVVVPHGIGNFKRTRRLKGKI